MRGYWHVFPNVILFNCKMPMQVLLQIKFPQYRFLVTSWEHSHIGAPDDFIVLIVFQQFGVIFLVFRVNVS